MKKVIKDRIDWIDTLRGLGMFLVVWGHCYINHSTIRKYLYSFHMPLFFFVSGLTFSYSDKITLKEYAKKKFNRLVVPYIVLNIVCYFLWAILSKFGIDVSILDFGNKFDYLEYFLGMIYSNNRVFTIPCGPSWFLLSLFLIEVMFYFFKKNSKTDFELGIVCSICGLISYVNSLSKFQVSGPWHIESVFTGIVFYYIGYIFMKNIKKFDFVFKDKIRTFVYGLLLGLIGVVGQLFNRRVTMDANLYGSIFLFYFNSLCSIAGLVCFVRLILSKSIIFKDIGKKTMIFIGYHVIIIVLLAYFYPILFSSTKYILFTSIIITTIIYLLSFPVYKYFKFLVGKFNFLSKI